MALGRRLPVGPGDGHHGRGHPGQPGGGVVDEVSRETALQRGRGQAGQVDQQRYAQGGHHGQRGGQPADDPDHHDHHLEQRPTPPPTSGGGGSRPAARSVPAARARAVRRPPPGPPPPRSTATTATPPRPTSATTASAPLAGVDAPPPDGEPGHRPGQVVLALGHPQPPRARRGHRPPTQQATVTQATRGGSRARPRRRPGWSADEGHGVAAAAYPGRTPRPRTTGAELAGASVG